ncbi:hypothetical protein D9M08_19815 [Escherichia albertii]|nr:hypothetical protein [Escherichia albertii]EEW7553008.1 hypothetical protein [Escherichia albertii]EFO0324357.1 hypothetical protein [Escherichia albertii]
MEIQGASLHIVQCTILLPFVMIIHLLPDFLLIVIRTTSCHISYCLFVNQEIFFYKKNYINIKLWINILSLFITEVFCHESINH